jgi:hypothetical protein
MGRAGVKVPIDLKELSGFIVENTVSDIFRYPPALQKSRMPEILDVEDEVVLINPKSKIVAEQSFRSDTI